MATRLRVVADEETPESERTIEELMEAAAEALRELDDALWVGRVPPEMRTLSGAVESLIRALEIRGARARYERRTG